MSEMKPKAKPVEVAKAKPVVMMREVRERRGMSQFELAEDAGISRSMVSMIECGQRRNPSLDVIKGLAVALGVSPRWVVNALMSE